MKDRNDKPLYAALFTEGALQGWLDKTAGKYLHDLISKGSESQIIDSISGLGHRLRGGHDLAGFLEITQEEGIEGAATWFQHMFADLMSSDGIPLPGASYVYRFLEDTVGVSERFFVDWMCVSTTDILSSGLSLLILARMYKIGSEEKRIKRLCGLTIGQIALLSLAETNPFFLATIPLQVLLMNHEWKKSQLKRIKTKLRKSEDIKIKAKDILADIKGY